MTISRETLLELMALADGELEGDARERAEALARDDDRARGIVAAFQAPALKSWIAREVDSKSSLADSVAASVCARIEHASADRDGVHGRPSLPPAPRARRTHAAERWVAFALAAGFAVAIGAFWHRPAPVAIRGDPSSADRLASAQASALGVEVDEIDSPVHGISLFEVRGHTSSSATEPRIEDAGLSPSRPSTVVIWVDDEPGAP